MDYWIFLQLAKKYPCGVIKKIRCSNRVHANNLSKSQRVIGAIESVNAVKELLPDNRLLSPLKYQYSNLAIMYLKEGDFLSAFVLIFKHQLIFIIVSRILKKISK